MKIDFNKKELDELLKNKRIKEIEININVNPFFTKVKYKIKLK